MIDFVIINSIKIIRKAISSRLFSTKKSRNKVQKGFLFYQLFLGFIVLALLPLE